jgi:hypothetical protein
MRDARLTWIVQANMRDQRMLAQVEAALGRLGEDVLRVELVPFSREVPALAEIPDRPPRARDGLAPVGRDDAAPLCRHVHDEP